MLLPLAAALAMFMPLNPDADQAALRAAFEDRAPARVGIGGSDPRAAIGDWTGAGCRSGFTANFAGGESRKLTVDWSNLGQRITREPDANAVTLVGGVSEAVSGVQFYFETPAKADRALAAMQRLQAACTPLR